MHYAVPRQSSQESHTPLFLYPNYTKNKLTLSNISPNTNAEMPSYNFTLKELPFFLLFLIASTTVVAGATGRNLRFDMSSGGAPTSGTPTGATGSGHGPNWDYSWGWGSGPGTGYGYGSGSSRSPTGFARGYGYGFGSGSGSGSGYGYGSSSGGARAGGYGSGSGKGYGNGGGGHDNNRLPSTFRSKTNHG